MRGEGEEVGADGLHVHMDVRRGLCAVDHQVAALLVHAAAQLLDGVLHAKDVGHVHNGQDLGLRADLGVHLLGRDDAVLVGVKVDELRAGRAAGLLPRDEVGVVLHDGDAHLVAGLKHGGGEGLRHDVERLGGVAREHDVVRVGRSDELRHALAGDLDGLGGFDRQAVQAAQGVGVHLLVEATLRVKHGGGALRGGGAVQKHQVGMVGKQREVALVGVLGDVGGAHDVAGRGRGVGGVRRVGHGARRAIELCVVCGS